MYKGFKSGPSTSKQQQQKKEMKLLITLLPLLFTIYLIVIIIEPQVNVSGSKYLILESNKHQTVATITFQEPDQSSKINTCPLASLNCLGREKYVQAPQ
jgi:uncharacterized membrane protein